MARIEGQASFVGDDGVEFDALRDGEIRLPAGRGGERGLTDKMAAFIREYPVDFNGTQAAIRAGYSEATAYSIASELLKKPVVMEELAKLRGDRMERLDITADRVLQEVAKLAFYDPRAFFHEDGRPKQVHELDEMSAAAVAGMDVSKVFEGKGKKRKQVGITLRFKLADKGQNLERLGRHLKLWSDKLDVNLSGSVAGMSEAEIDGKLAALGVVLAGAQGDGSGAASGEGAEGSA